jgi:hypothetical protein
MAAERASFRGAPASDRWSWVRWLLAVIVVVGLALAVRLQCGRSGLIGDEVYHILAARNYLDHGVMETEPGEPYLRGMVFTWMIAQSFAWGGESLTTARLPSVIFSTASVMVILCWVRREAGLTAGVLAGLLAALAAPSVYFSQVARFYAPQYFAVLVMWWMTAQAVRYGQSWTVRMAAALLALTALGIGVHFQVTTLIPAAVAAGWAAVMLTIQAWGLPHRPWVRWGWSVLPAALVVAALAVTATFHDLSAKLEEAMHFTPTWSLGHVHDVFFYWREMSFWYQGLWWGLPVAVVLALLRPRVSWSVIALWLFGIVIPLAVHSVLPAKALRYVYYMSPCLFALWGIAGAVLLETLWRAFSARLMRWRWSPGAVVAALCLATAVMTGLGAYVLNRTYAFYLTRVMLTDPQRRTPFTDPDWNSTLTFVDDQVHHADIVLCSGGMKAAYYIPYRATGVIGNLGMPERPEDLRDYAFDAATLTDIVRTHPRGLVLVEEGAWRNTGQVEPVIADVLLQLTKPMELPTDTDIMVFQWGFDSPAPKATARANLLVGPEPVRARSSVAPGSPR